MSDILLNHVSVPNIVVATALICYFLIGLHMAVARFSTSGGERRSLLRSVAVYACVFLVGPVYALFSVIGYGVGDFFGLLVKLSRAGKRQRGFRS